MPSTLRRSLPLVALVAALTPAVASAQIGSFGNAFGAPVRTEAAGSYGLTPAGGASFFLLASHDCATLGVGVCNPLNDIQQGNGTYNYAPFNAVADQIPGYTAGPPASGSNFTGSVATLPVTVGAGGATLSFQLAYLFNPQAFTPDDGFNPETGADFITMRRFNGPSVSGTAANATYLQLTSAPGGGTQAGLRAFGSSVFAAFLPLAATGNSVFTASTGFLTVSTALAQGDYVFEFAAIDQGNKDNVAGVAIANLQLTPASVVPEPSTYALLGAGLAGLAAAARRRRA